LIFHFAKSPMTLPIRSCLRNLVGRTRNEDGEPGDEVDITFIPGEVTPEKVTVPPEEPAASSDEDAEPASKEE